MLYTLYLLQCCRVTTLVKSNSISVAFLALKMCLESMISLILILLLKIATHRLNSNLL